MADLSFTQEEASTVLSKSNDAAVDSETKMKEIIQKYQVILVLEDLQWVVI